MATNTPAELIAKLTGQRRSRLDPADVLKGRVALAYGLRYTGLTLHKFGQEFIDKGKDTNSKLAHRWAQGRCVPGLRWIVALERVMPGIQALYQHPVFELLRDCPMGQRRIAKLLACYKNPRGPMPYWRFSDEMARGPDRFVSTVLREDSSALWQRGDLDGFTVILGLVREAEARSDAESHIFHAANLYRALPAVARLPWFFPHWDLLRYCVQRIHLRNFLSLCCLNIDWLLIEEHIRAQSYEPLRVKRPWNSRTGRFEDLKDPVGSAVPLPSHPLIKSPLESEAWRKRRWW